MVVIGYHPMLRHDHSTAGATAQCCVGSTPVRSGAVVHAGHVAGSGHAEAQGQSADGPSLVSPLASAWPTGIESHGATGPKTAARCPAAGAGRARVAPGAAGPRLPHRSVDAAARGDGHRTLDWRALSRRPCLVHPARAAVVVATSHAPGARAGRVAYSAGTLIRFLRHLKRHFRGRPVTLIWDGLGAHTSRVMRAYLARQRRWLHVERLPGYAPELNPIEQVWGNVKVRELANVCAAELTALRRPL